jgi:hypothetical protein
MRDLDRPAKPQETICMPFPEQGGEMEVYVRELVHWVSVDRSLQSRLRTDRPPRLARARATTLRLPRFIGNRHRFGAAQLRC